MKQHSGTLLQGSFTQHSQLVTSLKKNRRPIVAIIKDRFCIKELIHMGSAILGIGSVLLLSIYLFFAQLAEYGW